MRIKDIKAEIKRLQSKINGNAEEDNETLQQIEELQQILNKTNGINKRNCKAYNAKFK